MRWREGRRGVPIEHHRECHHKLVAAEAEVKRLREALVIASDMFRGEGWTEYEQGRIAQVRAALKEATE